MNAVEKFLGAQQIKVRMCDGSERDVTVREVPLMLIGEWARLDGDGSLESELKLAALYTGLTDAEVESLSAQSFAEVIDLGGLINRPIFSRRLLRQADREKAWLAVGEEHRKAREDRGLSPVLPTPPQASASSSDGSQPK